MGDTRNLAIAANNRYVVGYDNLSGLSAAPKKELPDEETSKSATNHVKIHVGKLHQCHMRKPS
jgi:hypothetical protein